jgi:ankyrin repeat protein
LPDGVQTGSLQKLLKVGWPSPGDIFAKNLRMIDSGLEPSDASENVRILIDHGFDLNAAIWPEDYSSCYTRPQLAACWDSLDMVRCLVDAGADINNTPEECSYTTLGEAVRAMAPEVVRFLMQNGADLEEFANDQEMTLLELAVVSGEYRGRLLEFFNGHGLEIFNILLESGADINGPTHRKPTSNWNTALTRAILHSGGHEMIYLVLDAGAEIHQIGGGILARTPLQAAAQKGEVGMAKELLQRGACVNVPAAPVCGETALQAACKGGRRSEEMISLLLEWGADGSAPPAEPHFKHSAAARIRARS